MKLDGRLIAKQLLTQQKKEVTALKKKHITPHLSVILVGNDEASKAYVKQKKLKGEAIGIHVLIHEYTEQVSINQLLKTIKQLNKDRTVHGIIIQQPLPDHIDPNVLVEATDPAKDVDGFHKTSQFTPPIAEATITILNEIFSLRKITQGKMKEKGYNATIHQFSNSDHPSQRTKSDFLNWLRKNQIVVIGKGETGGKPIADKLKLFGITPTIIDSKTKDPQAITRNADIIISCVGKRHVITKDDIKKGVILLSIGMHRGEDGKLHGDYDEEDIKNTAGFYTPVPGGVGPVNVAMLLQNVLIAAQTSKTHS